MIGLPPLNGRRYWLTSVPQTPATSTFNRAASSDISGRSNSRNSMVDGPTFMAASVVSVTTITSYGLYDALVYVRHKRRATRVLPLERYSDVGAALVAVATLIQSAEGDPHF